MTQEDLAHRCGLFRTYMSRIETGAANPTLTMIHALAGSLRVPVTALFEDDAAPKARVFLTEPPNFVQSDLDLGVALAADVAQGLRV